LRLTVFAAFLAVVMAAAPASAVKMRGGLAGSFYNHDDDISAHDRNVSRFKIRLDVEDFMAYDSEFHLRVYSRSTSGSDYNDKIPSQRIDRAEFSMSRVGGFMDLSLGRINVTDMFSTRVDGANAEFRLGSSFGLGAFAGMTPDPFSDQFSGSYSTFGAYLFNRTDYSRFSLGYVSTAKGGPDSSYLNGMYFSSSKYWNWIANLRMDENKDEGKWEITEALVNGIYRPSRKFKVSFSLDEYRAIRLYDTMDYDVNYEKQRSFRVNANLFILSHSLLYVRADARHRDIDSATASLSSVGFNQSELFNILFFDTSFSSINYFNTESTRFNFRTGAEFKPYWRAEFELMSITTLQVGQSNEMSQFVYGFTVDFNYEQFYASAMMQMSNESFLDVDAVYLNKASDTFAATTYHLTVGYYF